MEWISVDKELPMATGNVLVFVNDIISSWQEIVNAYICPEYGNIIWETIEGEDYTPIITDWMPLPDPPSK